MGLDGGFEGQLDLGRRQFNPEVRLLICIPFHCCQGAIDRTEDMNESDTVRRQGEDVVMEPMVMKEV